MKTELLSPEADASAGDAERGTTGRRTGLIAAGYRGGMQFLVPGFWFLVGG